MNVRTEGNAPLPVGGYGCSRLLAWSIGEPRPRCREWDARGPTKAKVRGRNRITGNRSVRSRSLAPSPPPPRIAIASDVPRGAASTMEGEEGSRLVPVPLTHLARCFDRRVVSDHSALAISDNEIAKLTCGDKRASVHRRFVFR